MSNKEHWTKKSIKDHQTTTTNYYPKQLIKLINLSNKQQTHNVKKDWNTSFISSGK